MRKIYARGDLYGWFLDVDAVAAGNNSYVQLVERDQESDGIWPFFFKMLTHFCLLVAQFGDYLQTSDRFLMYFENYI